MKNYTLLIFLLILGFSEVVYGQQRTQRQVFFRPENSYFGIFPNDTVIMRGEEIEVGSYLKKSNVEEVEIVDFGRSKKSDFEKLEKYVLKLKPNQTTTYVIKRRGSVNGRSGAGMFEATVYVAKNEEEKKQLEAQLKAKKAQMQEDLNKGRINIGAIMGPPPAKK